MLRLSELLITLCVFTFNAQASTLLTQSNSTGEDGPFNLLSDSTLFADPDSIYNFTDFTIAAGTTLNITDSGPVYIYSQQSITISGSLIADTPDLHLIAPSIIATPTGSISTLGDLNIINTATVPLPGAFWLLVSGLLLSFGIAKRRNG